MPSRKRAQGRARKARAAPPGGERAEICTHGYPCPLTPTQQQVIDTFCDTARKYLTELFTSDPFEIMMEVLEKHPDILRLDENRKLIQAYLVKLSTDNLLKNETEVKFNTAGTNAFMLSLLEGGEFTKQNPFNSTIYNDLSLKHADLFQGCKQSAVKFYRK